MTETTMFYVAMVLEGTTRPEPPVYRTPKGEVCTGPFSDPCWKVVYLSQYPGARIDAGDVSLVCTYVDGTVKWVHA